MSVYVDDYQRRAQVGGMNAIWSHLMADTDGELHAFAARLGLARVWHQHAGRPTSHYDVTEPKRQLALELGAVAIRYMSRESLDLVRARMGAGS